MLLVQPGDVIGSTTFLRTSPKRPPTRSQQTRTMTVGLRRDAPRPTRGCHRLQRRHLSWPDRWDALHRTTSQQIRTMTVGLRRDAPRPTRGCHQLQRLHYPVNYHPLNGWTRCTRQIHAMTARLRHTRQCHYHIHRDRIRIPPDWSCYVVRVGLSRSALWLEATKRGHHVGSKCPQFT